MAIVAGRVELSRTTTQAPAVAQVSPAETKEDMDRLQKEFWGSISLPWNGATVRLRKI
jgi:hypothetical protein